MASQEISGLAKVVREFCELAQIRNSGFSKRENHDAGDKRQSCGGNPARAVQGSADDQP